MSDRTHRGSAVRDFLSQEGLEVEARALKRAVARQLDRLRKEQSMSKSKLASRMNTSNPAKRRAEGCRRCPAYLS